MARALQYDGDITIAEAKSRFGPWHNRTVKWSEFLHRLETPARASVTLAEALSLGADAQTQVKDRGAFVGGALRGGDTEAGAHKGRDDVLNRSMITFDVDRAGQDFFGDFTLLWGYASVCYSTFKDSAENPRRRLLLPLTRAVTPDEYTVIAQIIAWEIGGWESIDHSSFTPNQCMFFPVCPRDTEYFFDYIDGPWIDPGEVLTRAAAVLPSLPAEAVAVPGRAREQADPAAKPGAIGAFCRAYDVPAVISEFLSDVYLPTVNADRYTYAKGSTFGGLVVYDGKFAYSHHATDPAHGTLCNAFDLVRIHKFGHLDSEAAAGTPTQELPSFRAMINFVNADPEAAALIQQERRAEIDDEFDDGQTTGEKPSKGPGRKKRERLSIDALKMEMAARGWGVRLNDITLNFEYSGLSPEGERLTGDNLVADLHDQLGGLYTGVTQSTLEMYIHRVGRAQHFNPVLDLLRNTVWDGVDRFPQLMTLIGVDDELSKTLIRKWSLQSIALLFNDLERPYGAAGALTFNGDQGFGKTELCRKLAIKEAWFSEGSKLNRFDKDCARRIVTRWIAELGELEQSFRLADVESLKTFITSNIDRYRLPYGHADLEIPRHTSICATCNSQKFLQDHTGNRRWWTVPFPRRIPRDELDDFDAVQYWAQFYSIVSPMSYDGKKSCFRLTRDEEDALNDRNSSTYEKEVKGADVIGDILAKAEEEGATWRLTTVSDWKIALKYRWPDLDRLLPHEISKALAACGVETAGKTTRVNGGKPERFQMLPFPPTDFSDD